MEKVEFSPDAFIVVNLVIVTFLVVSYAFIRRGSRPSVKLNLKASGSSGRAGGSPSESVVRNPSRVEYRPRTPRYTDVQNDPGDEHDHPEEKELNVLFNWNGHTWDAYEVLGIPAGSSAGTVQNAFERMRTSVEAESVPFVTAAFDAIQNRR